MFPKVPQSSQTESLGLLGLVWWLNQPVLKPTHLEKYATVQLDHEIPKYGVEILNKMLKPPPSFVAPKMRFGTVDGRNPAITSWGW